MLAKGLHKERKALFQAVQPRQTLSYRSRHGQRRVHVWYPPESYSVLAARISYKQCLYEYQKCFYTTDQT